MILMTKIRLLSITLIVLSLALAWLPQPVSAVGDAPLVLVVPLDGEISSITADFLTRVIRVAESKGAELMVLELNTPGGSIDAMNRIVQVIRSSSVPVVVYVSPRGAMAASAGSLITLAGHLSAMAPETVIGAASPVGSAGEDLGETMEAKVKEILKATASSLIADRNEAAKTLAAAMIDNARAVSVDEALKAGLIDIKANNLDDLLTQLDGRQVKLADGSRILVTTGAQVEEQANTLIEQLLGILTNSNVVLILMTIGVQAILIELSSPGGWVAGFLGFVCLALGIYGLGYLPVNWFGIIFLVAAFVLFIVEIKAPTHGGLTVAGIASFIIGALVLFNSPQVPEFQRVSVPLVIGLAVFTAGLFFAVLTFAIRAQRSHIRTGMESMAGRPGVISEFSRGEGHVLVGGESWSARLMEGGKPLRKNDPVEVVSVDGLKLVVKKRE
jgi:membrane-bound serine protease (ClpP class)